MVAEPQTGMNQSATTPAAAPPPVSPPAKACGNCGAPLHGPFCYACGQPEKGMVRHLASVLSDVADTIFNVDSRIFRSIPALYFRPGFLTREYFAGRRTRYVTPFRLFFFLCVIAFFAIQFNLSIGSGGLNLNLAGASGINDVNHAMSEAELAQRTATALHDIEVARNAPDVPDSAIKKLDKSAATIRKQSDRRLAWLKAKQAAEASGAAPPQDPNADDGFLEFDAQPWDAQTHPLVIGWLPAFANARLNEAIGRAKENFEAAKRDPRRGIAGLFSVLPQTLFVLMPLFALLLKITYLFKRRLYMEHLMVALHSHAFIFLSLLLLAIVQLLLDWAATDAPAALPLLRLLRAAMWTWLPLYLLLMQKRIYGQGWFMTVLKYGFVGFSYVFILAFGIAGAVVASLALT